MSNAIIIKIKYLELEETASTNDATLELARSGAEEGLVVIAKRQTRGRGREGREWLSQEGNLFCSILLRPKSSPETAAQIGIICVTSLSHALTNNFNLSSANFAYKWPNDLLLNGRKVAGILLEGAVSNKKTDYVVAGTGVNLVHSPDIKVEPGRPSPSSIYQESGIRITPEELRSAYINEFITSYTIWQDKGFEFIRERWISRACNMGKEVTIKGASGEIKGTLMGMDSTGRLEIMLENGELRHISAGEIYFKGS